MPQAALDQLVATPLPQFPSTLVSSLPQAPASTPPLIPGMANLSLGGMPFFGNPGMLPNQQMSMPMQYGAMGAMSLGPMMDTTRPNAMAALQTGQAQQNAMQSQQEMINSAIRAQYGSQLEQYQQSQKQFADWAKKYEDYQRTVAAQQQQYQQEQQQYQQYQAVLAQQRQQMPQQSPSGATPRRSLMQTATRSESARELALSARERALASRGKALAAREAKLRAKAAEVRAEEVKEEQEQAKLEVKTKALAEKEKQVQVFQSELVQEQRKIWKVLRSRNMAKASPASASNPSEQASHTAQVPPKPRALRPARVQVATKHHSTGPRPKALALAQMSSSAKVKNSHHASAVRRARAAAATSVQDGLQGYGTRGKSDLHVVMSAPVPKEGTFEATDADDDDDASQSKSESGDEDSKGTNDNNGATTDNDDLEQILLEQSSAVKNKDDPVESL